MSRVFLVGFAILGLAAGTASADLAVYTQDFEGYDPAPANLLLGDGWFGYVNVTGVADGGYWYGYGFEAPNNPANPNISVIGTGEGGAAQGNQQLVVFSDYVNGDHGNGGLLETNVYQERTVGAADVGSSWTFTFDAKHGDLAANSTALGFIKTLDPSNGWALTNYLSVDLTSIPTTWGTYSVSIDIDASLADQILQFGFSSSATNYEPSGMVYDNVVFTPEPASLVLVGMGALLVLRRRR